MSHMKDKIDIPRLKPDAILFLVLCSVLTTIFGLVLPFTILIIFDRIVPNQAMSTLWFLFIIIILSIILDYQVKKLESQLISKIVSRFEGRLSSSIFRAVCNANIARFHKYTPGEYLERIATIPSIKDFFGGEWIKAIINLFTAIVILIIVAMIDLKSGLILLAASIILLYFAKDLSTKKNKNLQEKSDIEGFTSSKIIEIVSNPTNLKSSAMEYRIENLMNDLVIKREKYSTTFETMESDFNLKLSMIQQCSVSMVLIACGMGAINLDLSQGVMAAVIMLTNRFFSPIQQVAQTTSRYRLNMMFLERLEEVLALQDFDTDKKSLERVNKISLPKLNQELKLGELYIARGPASSGKSHLAKAIVGDATGNFHNIHINDVPLDQIKHTDIRNHILRIDKNTGFVEGNIIDNITCFQPELYKSAYSLCESMKIKGIIDELRMGFYTELNGSQAYPFSRQVAFSLVTIRALLSKKFVLVIDDIDQIYDKEFGHNLINCIQPRADSLVVVLVSNKLSKDHPHIKDIYLKNTLIS